MAKSISGIYQNCMDVEILKKVFNCDTKKLDRGWVCSPCATEAFSGWYTVCSRCDPRSALWKLVLLHRPIPSYQIIYDTIHRLHPRQLSKEKWIISHFPANATKQHMFAFLSDKCGYGIIVLRFPYISSLSCLFSPCLVCALICACGFPGIPPAYLGLITYSTQQARCSLYESRFGQVLIPTLC